MVGGCAVNYFCKKTRQFLDRKWSILVTFDLLTTYNVIGLLNLRFKKNFNQHEKLLRSQVLNILVHQLTRQIIELFVYPWKPRYFCIFVKLDVLAFRFGLLDRKQTAQKWSNRGTFYPTLFIFMTVHYQNGRNVTVFVIENTLLSF